MPSTPDRTPDDPRGATTAPVGSPTSVERGERRGFLIAGAFFLGAMVVLVGLTLVFSGDSGDPKETATTVACATDDVECLAAQESVERPGIIPLPGEGQAPEEPGDRGGWEQIAVFGALVAGVGLIIVLIVRGSRKARAQQRGDATTG